MFLSKEIKEVFRYLKNKKKPKNRQVMSVKCEAIAELALYYSPSCPFCRLVLKQIHSQSLDIQLHNIHENKQFKEQLISGGGKKTIPCLKINKTDGAIFWMYESLDIVEFLQRAYSH